MNAARKTPRDRMMIALVVVPPVTLLLFCVSAAAKWQTTKAKIRPLLEQTIAPELIDSPSPAGAAYAARTNDENTERYQDLVAAINVLNARYAVLFEILDDEMDWADDLDTERPSDHAVRDYLVEADPLLQLLKELKPNLSSIWFPYESGNPVGTSNALIYSRGIPDLLRVEYRAAVRAKQPDRAIEVFDLFQSLGAGTNTLDAYQLLPLVLESLQAEIWSAADLEQIDQLVQDSPDFDSQWRSHLEGVILEQSPRLLYGKELQSWSRDPIPRTYSPSQRLHWLENTRRYLSVGDLGTLRSVKQVLEIEADVLGEPSGGLDTSIQVPTYSDPYGGGISRSSLARMYVKAANDHRFARTAIAIVQYKLKFNSYPQSLDDLNQVDLPTSATLDPLERAFRYESNGTGCTLGNASIIFTEGHASWVSFQTDGLALASLLQSNRELKLGDANR